MPAPLDVIETLDKNKARGLLEDLLTRMLPVFAADGSDDMALLAQAHHLSPVFLEYLDPLLKNIARTLYDGIRELGRRAVGRRVATGGYSNGEARASRTVKTPEGFA